MDFLRKHRWGFYKDYRDLKKEVTAWDALTDVRAVWDDIAHYGLGRPRYFPHRLKIPHDWVVSHWAEVLIDVC